MVSRSEFEIAYGGLAVDNGTMDVRDLAPALLSLGGLIENANRVVGDPDTQIKVLVKSSFEQGSFQIFLEVVHTLSEQIQMFLNIKDATSSTDAILGSIGLISGMGMGLIPFIKAIKGRKIENATILENGNTRIEFIGESGQFEHIEVREDVINLYRDADTRNKLKEVLEPLKDEGIDRFYVRKGRNTIESVSKSEVNYFELPELNEPEETKTSVRDILVNLVEVAFEDSLKWRLSEGDNKFYAAIADDDFLDKINTGEAVFTKGDVLEIQLETTQVATSKGITNQHKVLEVKRHIKFNHPQQIPLPFDNSEKI